MNTCETCKAFSLERTECRFFPPVYQHGERWAQFPVVMPLHWCLEWKSKEKKEPVKRDVKERSITVAEYVYACEVKGVSPVSQKHRDFARTLAIDPGPEWGKFMNYCLAHGKRYVIFESAFRNWLANSVNMPGGKR